MGISAIALGVSVTQCSNQRSIPQRVAAYNRLSAAASNYSEAFQNFDNFLRRPHLVGVFGDDPPAKIRAASREDFLAFYNKSQQAMDRYDAYTTAVNKVQAAFPSAIGHKIVAAGASARESMACYLVFQAWADEGFSNERLDDLKHDALIFCSKADGRERFEDLSNDAISDMNKLVEKALPDVSTAAVG